MKTKRHSKILELIANNEIETQEELTERLSSFGFGITQATVSRDIKELRLIKTLSDNGRYIYSQSKKDINISSPISQRFHSIFKEGAISVDFAINLVVIKCFSGMANAVCAAIDASSNSGIIGTIAGDDTIFIAARSEELAVALVNEFQKMLATED